MTLSQYISHILHIIVFSVKPPGEHAGLLSAEEQTEWKQHNPSPLIRAFRRMSSVSGYLSRAVAALSETPLGGRILFDALVKPAAGAHPPFLGVCTH